MERFAVDCSVLFVSANNDQSIRATLSLAVLAHEIPKSPTASLSSVSQGWFAIHPYFDALDDPGRFRGMSPEIHGRHGRIRAGTAEVIVIAEGDSPANWYARTSLAGEGPWEPPPSGIWYGREETFMGQVSHIPWNGWSIHVQQVGIGDFDVTAPVVSPRQDPTSENPVLLGRITARFGIRGLDSVARATVSD